MYYCIMTHLHKPGDDDNARCRSLLRTPHQTSRGDSLFISHVLASTRAAFRHFFLCCGVGHAVAVMRCVNPPDHSKEHGPDGRKNVVCKE